MVTLNEGHASNRALPYLHVANVMKLLISLVILAFTVATLGIPKPQADVATRGLPHVTEVAYAATPSKKVTPTKPAERPQAPVKAAEPQAPAFDANNPATYPKCADNQVVWAQDGACHDKVVEAAPVAQAAAPAVAAPSNGASSGCGDNEYAHFIYMHESGCRTNAVNEIGACGIGQANPCSKMPCSLSDYDCQNRFFTSYAMARYGSWAAAYNYWVNNRVW